MVKYVFDGLLYLGGLVLFVMPPESIPYWDGSRSSVRLTKHAIALGLFVIGTMGIHEVAREWTGFGFVLASAFLLIGLSLVRILSEKGLST